VLVSYNDLVVKAVATALRDVPAVNASRSEEAIILHNRVDVGVAVALPDGLITPVLRNADQQGLEALGSETRELAEKARDRKLQPEEYSDSTFTSSNLGMMGISHFTAIINPPQSCILAVGGPQKKVLPNQTGDGYKTVNTVSVTLSCDHRVVDGAVGAHWLKHFKKYIEQPTSMLL
jgi:pyruvate dehydrogenase E2 component (dihydrolipoamide acetyltransferase)